MRVNWSTAICAATTAAKSRGQEANVTQLRNCLNDLVEYLTSHHTPWDILEGIYRLAQSAPRTSRQ